MEIYRKKFVIFDRDSEYANGLGEYLMKKGSRPFEVTIYTGYERFKQFVSCEDIDVLIISEEAYRNLCSELVRGMNIWKVFILTEDTTEKEIDEYAAIYKYQSGDNILKKMMEEFAEEVDEILVPRHKGDDAKLIAVYSPVKRTLKTSFAMTMGQILSETKRVLYLNLEDYAGFNSLLKTSYATDMSDLIYYISQRKPNFIWKLSSMVQSVGGLDYIPPALAPMDIKEVTKDQWMEFLDELIKCEYEVIILDLGDSVRGIYQMLRRCSRIYTPTRDDGISYAKMEQYEALLNVMGYHDVLEKSRKLSFSYFKGLERGLDRLVYSELGQYVRGLLFEDGVLV